MTKKILFNDKYYLTQAVLAGEKTMTRRKFTLTLDKNVNINLLDNESDNPATTFKTVSLEEFLKMVGTEQVHSYFYITVQNNIITDMYEQYVP